MFVIKIINFFTVLTSSELTSEITCDKDLLTKTAINIPTRSLDFIKI